MASFSFHSSFSGCFKLSSISDLMVLIFSSSSGVGSASLASGSFSVTSPERTFCYFLYSASSLSWLNGPIGLAKLAIMTEKVEEFKYGDPVSTPLSPFLAVVFKSRFWVLSTSSLFNGNTSDLSFNSRTFFLKKSLNVNLALPAEKMAASASSLFLIYSSQSWSSTLTLLVASISLSRMWSISPSKNTCLWLNLQDAYCGCSKVLNFLPSTKWKYEKTGLN